MFVGGSTSMVTAIMHGGCQGRWVARAVRSVVPARWRTGGCGFEHVVWLSLCCAAWIAIVGSDAYATSRLTPEVQTWQLDNGLTVAYAPVAWAPVVTVQLWYRVGSKDDPASRRGSAHMFEHLLFKGTTRVRPDSHARYLEGVGGFSNAFTHQDTTAYFNRVPKQYLQFACELEAERMRNLLLRSEMIRTERDVIKQEIRRNDRSLVVRGVKRFFEVAYTTHPYAWLPSGVTAELDRLSIDDLQSFYDAYYVPNNALLVVVGDVSQVQAQACAREHFGSITKGAIPPRPANHQTEPAQAAPRRQSFEPGPIGIVLTGYHIPRARHVDSETLQVLAKVLYDGVSSRLHRRLVRVDNIAVAAAGQLFLLEHPGCLLTYGVFLRPEHAASVEAALVDEVAQLRTDGPTIQELTRATTQLRSGLAWQLEGVLGTAQQIGFSWIHTGSPKRFLNAPTRLAAITRADVRRVASTYLIERNRTTVVIPPRSMSGVKGR